MSEQLKAVRTLDTIKMEIRVLQEQTQRVVLGYAIETGRRLEEAKAMVGHGEWGMWVRKMGYSQSTANNLMHVFREYGTSQQNLFGGEANSQALGNLSYTKALQLLALPDEETREAFTAEHDVEHMSTRELERALKERAEALAAAQAEARSAEDACAKMEADMRILKGSLREKDQAERDLLVTRSALKGERKESAALREDVKQLREQLKALRDKGMETRELTREERDALVAGAVEQARAADAQRMQAMEKQLAAADGDTAAFKVFFEAWQEDYGRMMGYLERIAARDREKAGKLRAAVGAARERMAAG